MSYFNLWDFTLKNTLLNFRTLPENVTHEDIANIIDQSIGFNEKIEYNPFDLELLQRVFFLNRYTAETAMEKVKIPCNELLFKCRWEGVMVPCMNIFRRSLTHEGYCCSYNIAPYNSPNFQGKRTRYFGYKNGLSVVLKPRVDAEANTKIFSEGIDLLIHESTVYPSDTAIDKLIPTRSETLVSVQATVTLCSNQVKALPISDRGCVFSEEYTLRYVVYCGVIFT